jgi:hypothetical protein
LIKTAPPQCLRARPELIAPADGREAPARKYYLFVTRILPKSAEMMKLFFCGPQGRLDVILQRHGADGKFHSGTSSLIGAHARAMAA